MRWDFWRRRRRETDLNDEIAYDLALDGEEPILSGATRQEAKQASRRDFGNVLLLKEGIREMWGWMSLQRLSQDLRYGWRSLRKSPLFATMAVLSLALGIGANTAIFSFMHAILMCSLPVWRPGELVILNGIQRVFPLSSTGLVGPGIATLTPDGPAATTRFLRMSICERTTVSCRACSALPMRVG